MSSLRELAEHFVDEELFGEIPERFARILSKESALGPDLRCKCSKDD